MADSEVADSGKTDSGRSEEPAVDEESAEENQPDQGVTERVESQGQIAEAGETTEQAAGETTEQPTEQATEQVPSATVDQAGEQHEESEDTEAPEDAEGEAILAAQRRQRTKGLLVGLGTGLLVGIIAALAFTWLAKPEFLVGPGAPDGKSSEVTAALASKNADGIAKATCRTPNGSLSQQLPAQALQAIQSAKPTSGPQRALDTEAVTPVTLTITEQGQTQDLPVDIVFGVTNGQWCMRGITQQQQPQQ